MSFTHKENVRIGIGFLGDFGGVAEHIRNIIDLSKYNIIPIYPPTNTLVKKYIYLTMYINIDPLNFMILRKNRKFDILHIHASPYLARYTSNNKGKSCKKYIQTFHGIPLKDDYLDKKLWKFREKENKILIESAKKADIVISVAKWLAGLLERRYGLESIHIPNGVNTLNFEGINAKEIENIRKKYNLPEEFFLFAGRLHKYKRPEMIIELAERNPDKRFIMIGKDINRFSLQKYMERKLPENVIPLGVITRDDYIAVMRMSKVFILPSRNEVFGIVLIEAMASQKVVVAANNGGPAEIIRNGVDGYLFEPDNINDLEEKALKAWDNPQLGENGSHRVKEKYDWRVIIKRIDSIYRDLL